LSFRIPYYEPDEIAARLYVEARLERHTCTKPVFQSLIFPMHGDGLLDPLKELSITIEDAGDTGQNVVVSSFDFSKVEALYVHMREDDKLGIGVAGFEKLGVQVHGEIMQFLLGEHCIFDLLPGLLVGTGEGFGSILAAARLQRQLLRVLELYLQGVKAAVEL
jgi:hypothetical protein